jgi:hypothetical protein
MSQNRFGCENGDTQMSVRFKKIHPALKHGGYIATMLLPGEDRAAFEKLHRDLVAEFNPVGALEKDIIANVARLTWRKQNLAILRIAEFVQARRRKIEYDTKLLHNSIAKEEREAAQIADEQARQEFGDIHQLIDVGKAATIDGLMKELDVIERLDGLINRCLKQLLIVRGVKSLSSAASSESTPQIAGPQKAG